MQLLSLNKNLENLTHNIVTTFFYNLKYFWHILMTEKWRIKNLNMSKACYVVQKYASLFNPLCYKSQINENDTF